MGERVCKYVHALGDKLFWLCQPTRPCNANCFAVWMQGKVLLLWLCSVQLQSSVRDRSRWSEYECVLFKNIFRLGVLSNTSSLTQHRFLF